MIRLGQTHLLLLCAALAAAPAARADALSAVQVLREGGCGGIVPAAKPLRHNLQLDRAAAAWAGGGALAQAGLTAGVHVGGPPGTVLERLRRTECHNLTNRSLREVGVYRRGTDTWLVLAGEAAAGSHWSTAGADAPAAGAAPPSGHTWHVPPSAAAAYGTAPVHSWTTLHPARGASSRQSSDMSARALQLVNEVRARGTHCGGEAFAPAPPLTLSGTLAGVALGHADDMARHDYFEHQDLAGQSPADRVRAVGYREKLVGENIAYGPQTVEEVVRGWLDSPGHCQNIMDPRFAQMGIADAPGQVSRRGLYWVQVLAEPT